MKRIKNFIYYTLIGINDWFTIFNIDFRNSLIVRAIIGGTWYKQTMSGELPNCYGSWWTKNPIKPHRFHYTEKIENY